ncbi:MAG TPA: gluconate 2-dehydrogenase, partial [Prolixibacteraceae bacterium]|nr:gluconate 2-dehydrogenase [Prolixibacteraceae bacterium]
KSFETLNPEDQITIMKAMESNQLNEKEWPQGKASDFFNLVLSHTMQGFYGSP